MALMLNIRRRSTINIMASKPEGTIKLLRVITHFSIILVAIAMVAEGALLARYEWVENEADFSSNTSDLPRTRAEFDASITLVDPWVSKPGVAPRATALAHGLASRTDNDNVVEARLVALLAVSPTNGTAWAELARLRFDREDDMTAVIDALETSIATAPLEVDAALTRLQLCFAAWGLLAEPLRTRMIGDGVRLAGQIDPDTQRAMQAILGEQPAETRMEISETLASFGPAGKILNEKLRR